MGVAQIEITNEAQKWRYRCPNGHSAWELTNNHMWCRTCSNQLDMDPEFWELYDQKTGETVPRERIVFEV